MSNRQDLIDLYIAVSEDEYNFSPEEIKYSDVPGAKDVKIVDEVVIDTGRWFEYVWTIVEFNGELFAVEWGRGLTELQDNDDFEPSESIIFPVESYEKTVTAYKRV